MLRTAKMYGTQTINIYVKYVIDMENMNTL